VRSKGAAVLGLSFAVEAEARWVRVLVIDGELVMVGSVWVRDATGDELVRMRYCFDVQKGIKRMG
jgi:hypothetical protein